MNPSPFAMAYHASRRAREDAARAARREQLHRAALARRRKAKRGGKR